MVDDCVRGTLRCVGVVTKLGRCMDDRVDPSLGCLGTHMMCYWHVCDRMLADEAADSTECSPAPTVMMFA